MNEDELVKEFSDFAKQDIEEALPVITGLFVGLIEAYTDLRGEDGDGKKEINIKGIGSRNITIHAAEEVPSHYIYVFGEADGPFACEHRDDSNHRDCNAATWSIFTEAPMDTRRAVDAGIALCKKHEPKSYASGSSAFLSLANLSG
jgi:hypothetical protein